MVRPPGAHRIKVESDGMVNESTKRQFDTSLVPRLRALGRRLRLYALLDGLAVLLPAVLAAILITLLLDRAFRLDHDLRVGQLLSGVILLGLIAWRWIWLPLRVPAGPTELALLVERRFPQLKSRLISAVEFAQDGARLAREGRSSALMNAVVHEAERHAAALRFADALSHRRARKRSDRDAGLRVCWRSSSPGPGRPMVCGSSATSC